MRITWLSELPNPIRRSAFCNSRRVRRSGLRTRNVGTQAHASAYVGDLVRAGIALRAFTPTETHLEALFFMLTDDTSTGAVPGFEPTAGAR